MELRHLKYFIAVAEELHFGKAAIALNMSQPPLSRQIKQLEKEIGAKLFTRTKRSVELTDAGKLFLEQSNQIFNKLESACESARKAHNGEIGKLSIGFSGSWSSELLRLLRDYRSKFPHVEVLLQQLSTTEQVRALNEKRIQIGILCPPIDSDLFNLRVIHHAPFVVALPQNHPLAKDTSPIDPIYLKEEPFIMTPRKTGPGYYDTIISIFHQAGFSPKIVQEAEGVFTILTLVAAEVGVSLVSTLALEHPKPGVVFRNLKDNVTTMDLSLAWRKDESSPIVNTFLNTFEEVFQST